MPKLTQVDKTRLETTLKNSWSVGQDDLLLRLKNGEYYYIDLSAPLIGKGGFGSVRAAHWVDAATGNIAASPDYVMKLLDNLSPEQLKREVKRLVNSVKIHIKYTRGIIITDNQFSHVMKNTGATTFIAATQEEGKKVLHPDWQVLSFPQRVRALTVLANELYFIQHTTLRGDLLVLTDFRSENLTLKDQSLTIIDATDALKKDSLETVSRITEQYAFTPAYAPLELFGQFVGPNSVVYSFGMTLATLMGSQIVQRVKQQILDDNAKVSSDAETTVSTIKAFDEDDLTDLFTGMTEAPPPVIQTLVKKFLLRMLALNHNERISLEEVHRFLVILNNYCLVQQAQYTASEAAQDQAAACAAKMVLLAYDFQPGPEIIAAINVLAKQSWFARSPGITEEVFEILAEQDNAKAKYVALCLLELANHNKLGLKNLNELLKCDRLLETPRLNFPEGTSLSVAYYLCEILKDSRLREARLFDYQDFILTSLKLSETEKQRAQDYLHHCAPDLQVNTLQGWLRDPVSLKQGLSESALPVARQTHAPTAAASAPVAVAFPGLPVPVQAHTPVSSGVPSQAALRQTPVPVLTEQATGGTLQSYSQSANRIAGGLGVSAGTILVGAALFFGVCAAVPVVGHAIGIAALGLGTMALVAIAAGTAAAGLTAMAAGAYKLYQARQVMAELPQIAEAPQAIPAGPPSADHPRSSEHDLPRPAPPNTAVLEQIRERDLDEDAKRLTTLMNQPPSPAAEAAVAASSDLTKTHDPHKPSVADPRVPGGKVASLNWTAPGAIAASAAASSKHLITEQGLSLPGSGLSCNV